MVPFVPKRHWAHLYWEFSSLVIEILPCLWCGPHLGKEILDCLDEPNILDAVAKEDPNPASPVTALLLQ